jgi:hypothetical protein
MTLGANSYGSVADVAALTKRFTLNGEFTTATTPTLAQVEKFLDTASAWINTYLAENGFTIPVTQADVKIVLDGLAVEAAADLVQVVNSAGRFFTEKAVERGLDPYRILQREVSGRLAEMATGFEKLGAARSESKLGTIACRDTDENGDEVTPIFQRNAFGNKFKDWNASND